MYGGFKTSSTSRTESKIPTPEMALFPGIMIPTSSNKIDDQEAQIMSDNNSRLFKDEFNYYEDNYKDNGFNNSSNRSQPTLFSYGIPSASSTYTSSSPSPSSSSSSSSMVHFKKALIYSSTNRYGNQYKQNRHHETHNVDESGIFGNNSAYMFGQSKLATNYQDEDRRESDSMDADINQDDCSSINVDYDNDDNSTTTIMVDPSLIIDDSNNDKDLDMEAIEQQHSHLQQQRQQHLLSASQTMPPPQIPGLMSSASADSGLFATPMMYPKHGGKNQPSPVMNSGAFPSSFSMMPQVITHVGRKPLNGPPCSLKTLVDDRILEPLDGSLTYEIMGVKFFGDLMINGFIRMSGTNQVFANPSSWANYCRSTIPSTSKDQKHCGSAWSIIRYLGKRLDSYKLRWYRKQKKQFNASSSSSMSSSSPSMMQESLSGTKSQSYYKSNRGSIGNSSSSGFYVPTASDITAASLMESANALANPYSSSSMKFRMNPQFPTLPSVSNQYSVDSFSTPVQMSRASVEYKNIFSMFNRDRLYKLDKTSAGDPLLANMETFEDEGLINFNSIDLNNKDLNLDERRKVSCVPFSSVYCLQPFLVNISTNVLLLIDFHANLISSEVNGYLAGTWDSRTQHLTITQAYPIRGKNPKEMDSYKKKIKKNLVLKGLILLGWYHSHPGSAPHPTIFDIKQQLKFQKQMLVDAKGRPDYSPCVGLICSPFNRSFNTQQLETLFQMFWVMPIFTLGNRSIGRPMQLSYSINRDAFLTQDLLVEMRILAAHFSTKSKFIKFNEIFQDEYTFWDKLQESLKTKLPKDLVETQSQAVQNDIQQQALMHFWSFLKNLLLI